MDIRISPRELSGEIDAVESKSDAHRLLICAALSQSPTEIRIKNISVDIEATISCLIDMGCIFEQVERDVFHVNPLWKNPSENPNLNCAESGSTLRFLLPVAASLFENFTITGSGRLPARPLAPIVEAMKANGCCFESETLPMNISRKLKSGKFYLPGDVSSQFISGLLFALPLLEGESEIILTSGLESSGYVDMTIGTLEKFGISIIREKNLFRVTGCQKYSSPGCVSVEGDWSNAAFWLAAGAMKGDISCRGLSGGTLQGDSAIVDILRHAGADVTFADGVARSRKSKLSGIELDASEIPDLVPVLAAVLSVAEGTSKITNIGRVRLKESDRLHAMAVNLNAIGADVEEFEDSLLIKGKQKLTGGATDGCNDHRIVMALAAVSAACEGNVVIKGAGAVEKSYPGFFNDFKKLGGLADVI